MPDTPEVTQGPAPESEEADSAIEALQRFAQSAQDFLKHQQTYAEGAQSKKALSQMEAEARKKDDEIREFKSAITIWTHRGNEEVARLESQNTNLGTQLQQALEEKNRVEAQVKETKRLLEERTEDLDQLKNEVVGLKAREEVLKTGLQKETDEKKGTTDELDKKQAELGRYAGYTAKLEDLDVTKFSKDAAKVWERTIALVEKHFSIDISTELLEEHDKWAQQACSFLRLPPGSLLLPATNTPVAKFARKATMMGVLALLLVEWIFTAISAPLAQAGLDAVLSELTDQEEEKEVLCRAILTSVSSGNPSQHKEHIRLVKWVVDSFGTLLPPKSRSDMKADIRKWLTETSAWWNKSRRSRQKLIATLDYKFSPNAWKDHPAPNRQRRKDSKNAEASDPEDEEEVAFISFPAIIAKNNSEWQPIHPGYLIRCSHLGEAEDEWRREREKRRFSRSGIPGNIVGLLSSRATRS